MEGKINAIHLAGGTQSKYDIQEYWLRCFGVLLEFVVSFVLLLLG